MLPEVSLVVPVYRNAGTVRELHRRLAETLSGRAWELLFIDDGCPEGSLAACAAVSRDDPRVAVLVHAHNAGQNAAVLTGLAYARGARVVVLDADLQDPPEAVPLLLEALQPGVGAVFGGRRGRYESASRLFTSYWFKRLIHWRSGRRLPADAGLFVALTHEMARRVLAQPDAPGYVLKRMAACGLPMISVPVARAANPEGRSSYTFGGRLRVAWYALTSAPAGPAAMPPLREKFGARFQPEQTREPRR